MARIHIVEDHLEILEMLVTILSRYFQVETSVNGREAFALLRQSPPDVAILDINVPGIDGLSLCKMLKEDPELRKIKVMILTAAYADDTGRTMSQAAGADAFLTKPVRSQILLERVNNLLASSSPSTP